MTDAQPPWWQSATGYQIYPRSFCDGNGDGIGDIPGILSRLDHLADLGVDLLWLSPVYRSPMVDNGYDISDYEDIAPEFGTMADFDRLLAETAARGIRVVMDLVVNHSSDQHAWFRSACADRQSPVRDFYIWRDPAPDGGPPNDMQSFFGGPAWTLSEETGQYYFHLFAPGQPDLNWQNPALRAEIHAMMNRWLDKGIAGFRMDVIDLIGKDPDRKIGFDGPDLHRFLQEMHRATLAGRDVVTIGECWSATPETALLYSGRARGEVSMVFQFEHVLIGFDPAVGKWYPKPVDLPALKRVFSKWQETCAEDGWNSLFWSNHDLPRAVSKYGDDGGDRVRSAKMLATLLHLMRGTPFIYQGEEIGMTNARFTRIEQFRDVETLNHHALELAKGVDEATFLAGANANGRDNARTPMQWTDGPNAGFTDGTPWIEVTPNYRSINVARDRADPDGIFAHYRRLTALRRDLPLVRDGRFHAVDEDHPRIFAYTREGAGGRISVLANVSGTDLRYEVPDRLAIAGTPVSWNVSPRDTLSGHVTLAPWEVVAIHAPAAPEA
jgi:oligo-1,6-glucosidase